jgi:hypothetical protein
MLTFLEGKDLGSLISTPVSSINTMDSMIMLPLAQFLLYPALRDSDSDENHKDRIMNFFELVSCSKPLHDD